MNELMQNNKKQYVLVIWHKPKNKICAASTSLTAWSTGDESRHLLCPVAMKMAVLGSIFSIPPWWVNSKASHFRLVWVQHSPPDKCKRWQPAEKHVYLPPSAWQHHVLRVVFWWRVDPFSLFSLPHVRETSALARDRGYVFWNPDYFYEGEKVCHAKISLII